MSYRSFGLHPPATRHTRPHRGASAARRYSTSLNDLETAVASGLRLSSCGGGHESRRVRTIGPGLLAPTMVGARQDIRPRARGAGYGYLGEPGAPRGCTETPTAWRITHHTSTRPRPRRVGLC